MTNWRSYHSQLKRKNHTSIKNCHICKKEFDNDDNKKYCKFQDHCHYTGKYRGAANNNCIQEYKAPKEVPVVLHNRTNYDYQFIIKELAK